ncbi:Acyl-CoA dehydrogenase, N-terminal domain [Melghirimyces thermohalophilus]|uniref:Acyl-CoA dehydrogenase, N-terminal domain n=1 Tax=Melghirimyces thermohalophilus TaxID=1236220 RepID=A0A1G6IVE8_9BACL|nr:Acyl-CoA dehydrogenase, N-terminal domain [Melghirimyces thermohalophilus]
MQATHAKEELHEELRRGVRRVCRDYPGSYWRKLDANREYPHEFVEALNRAGYLAALIPEEYGGVGFGVTEAAIILEEIHYSGGNAGACHACSDVHHGNAASPRFRGAKAKISTGDRSWLSAVASFRGDRTQYGHRYHPAPNDCCPPRGSLYRQRTESVHLPHRAVRSDDSAGPDHPPWIK